LASLPPFLAFFCGLPARECPETLASGNAAV
jgi:hypothetical protein